jgi:hypothetical protein
VIAIGAEKRFQMRLKLVPDMREWDGSYVDALAVSYAPRTDPQQQVIEIRTKNADALDLTAVVDGISTRGTGTDGLAAAMQAKPLVNSRFPQISVSGDTIMMEAVDGTKNLLFVAQIATPSPPANAYCVAYHVQTYQYLTSWPPRLTLRSSRRSSTSCFA